MARTVPLSPEFCPFQIIPDLVVRTAAITAAGFKGWDGTCPQGFLFEQGLFLRPSEWVALIQGEAAH